MQAQLLREILEEEGLETYVVTTDLLSQGGRLRLAGRGVYRLPSLNKDTGPMSPRALRLACGADLIVLLTPTMLYSVMVFLAAKLLNRKTIVVFHNPLSGQSASPLKRLMILLFKYFIMPIYSHADLRVAVSKGQLRHMAGPAVHIPNMLRFSLYRPRDKAVGRVLFVGRTTWEKGFDTYLQAMTQVRKWLDLKGAVASSGGPDVDVEWIEFHRGLQAEDMLRLYRASGVLLAPSRLESFGVALLEAMSQGLPVVASRIQPHLEVAGEAALYFEPGNHLEAARQIRKLYENQHLYRQMSRTAISRAVEIAKEAKDKWIEIVGNFVKIGNRKQQNRGLDKTL